MTTDEHSTPDEDREREVEVPAWMQADDDWEDERPLSRPRSSRVRLIAIVAVIPWLAAMLVMVRSGMAGGSTSAPDLPTPAPAAATDPSASTPPGMATPPAVRNVTSPRVAVTGADAVAMATAVARAWLTGVGPALEIDGLDERTPLYAEHLVAEAIDHPSPGLAVVTLLGIVLDVEDGAYRAASVRRLAVPVALDADGARPAGAPWWLPDPDLTPAEIPRSAVDDPDLALAVVAAAEAAGYRDVELQTLAATASWPLIATLRAIAPGRTAPEEHEVWLRAHLDGLVVAGWLPRPSQSASEERP